MTEQKTPMDKIPWACPNCGADAHGCGRLDAKPRGNHRKSDIENCRGCEGFLCECTDDGYNETHGASFADPCQEAVCYHCGWSGAFPGRPKKLPSWAKKALDAGFTPPKGWTVLTE